MSDLTPEGQVLMTRATMHILDSWKLGSEEMRTILGLPENIRARSFQKFRSHDVFPDDPEVARRADYVIRIAGALRTSYPTNPNMGGRWLRLKHRRFGRTPLSVLMNEGEQGLVMVLAELDCTFGWDLSGSGHARSAVVS
ncbi:MAG: DUF2384 domain-containing protein [Gammaproteobacteria bacterium]|nr:DUF2384 domain-containing protein [Gammaproteobacteria bacterium]MCP5406455.1 DUF2384 domain-containing protein [Chromatiaceae bacterium]MCP5443022.1 DUF2384 domain-containing protein [Chromatiaceae bacterium]